VKPSAWDMERPMDSTFIELSERELMQIESILIDEDKKEALYFIKIVIKPK
jgi:hypothetical protein